MSPMPPALKAMYACRLASVILIHQVMHSFYSALSVSGAVNSNRDGAVSWTATLASWARSC